jgi:hypothetical protein
MFVKPAIPGDLIRIPERDMRPLSQDGEEVADNQFWFRRMVFGDVVRAEPAVQENNKKNKEPK